MYSQPTMVADPLFHIEVNKLSSRVHVPNTTPMFALMLAPKQHVHTLPVDRLPSTIDLYNIPKICEWKKNRIWINDFLVNAIGDQSKFGIQILLIFISASDTRVVLRYRL